MVTTHLPAIWVPLPYCKRSVKMVTHIFAWNFTSACMCLPRCGAPVPELIRARPGVIAITCDLMFCNTRNCDALAKHVVLIRFLLHCLKCLLMLSCYFLVVLPSSRFPVDSMSMVVYPLSLVCLKGIELYFGGGFLFVFCVI